MTVHAQRLGRLVLLTAALLLFGAAAQPVLAQSLSIDLGGDGGGETTGRIIQLMALITVLTVAPSILVMVTSFTRIVVVLSFLRTAMGVQQTPPTLVLINLALFLTFFIMGPTLTAAYQQGLLPLINGEINEFEAFPRMVAPFHQFMMVHVRQEDLGLFLDLSRSATPATAADTPLQALIPAFIVSELRRAFEIGFLLFLPFLIIDMVVASVLMAMGMMMIPPVTVSLPFKLIFFVLVDGWSLISGSLVQSYGITAATAAGAG
ncbi:MAG TPA: flagellar type III secretion system pore protein FliP [Alphaproteobacteria bacterium]|nr:flagellar type III secretion system pore protein FliP [Alphaproteobacteria bacterium]